MEAVQEEGTTVGSNLYMAIEMSGEWWKVAVGNGSREREVNVPAGAVKRLEQEIALAKEKLRLGRSGPKRRSNDVLKRRSILLVFLVFNLYKNFVESIKFKGMMA